ncbi:cell envelope integrity protein TolA [Vibrio fluvialis]
MVRWILAISILFSWVAHANESIAEQQQAIDGIFSQMGVTSEAQRWGAIYTQLISQNLGTNSLYKDQVCWINLRLQPNGYVRKVTILHPKSKESYRTPNQELFCNEVFLVAFRLKRYPMPKQIDVIKNLLNVNLTIRPLSNEAKARLVE